MIDQTSTAPRIGKILAWFDTPRAERLSEEIANLQQQLDALISCAAPPQQRLTALDAFYQRIIDDLEQATPTLTSTPPPLSRKQKALLRSVQDTLLTFAHALLDSLDSVNTHLVRGLGQPAERSLRRAAHILYRHYLLSALVAAPAGRDLWLELHRTFNLAQNLHLAEARPEPEGQSIRDAYLTPILLSCALPASLNAYEVRFVAQYLAQSSQLADPPDETVPAFRIDPSRDSPFQAADRKQPAADDTAESLQLSFRRLCARLVAQESAIANGIPPEQLGLPVFAATPPGRQLMRKLAVRWNAPAKRRFPRRRQGYRCQIISGLETLIKTLHQQDAPSPHDAQWMVINESPDGCAIMHVSGKTGDLSVGDIAAIRTETGTNWQICLVRWIQSEHSEHFEAGLQILAASGTPATLIRHEQRADTSPQGVIILPAIPPLRETQTLIAPAGCLPETPSRFLLLIERNNLEIREMCSTSLDECSDHFDAFSIEDDEIAQPA